MMSQKTNNFDHEWTAIEALDIGNRFNRKYLSGQGVIAGSIRRQCKYVNDIDIVVKKSVNHTLPLNPVFAFGDEPELIYGGKGDFSQARFVVTCRGRTIKLEVWRVFDHAFGSQLIIRTGPEGFPTRYVSNLRKRGMRHEKGMILDDNDQIVPNYDEERAFELAGMKFIPPTKRVPS